MRRYPAQSFVQPPRRRRPPTRWFRLFDGFADHPKWRRVAKDADANLAIVIATVVKLLETANAGRPRGSVTDFSPDEWALSLGVERPVVDRIWHALETIGWIDREYVTKWDVWQPDKEDPTHAERQRRYDAKKRAERDAGKRPSDTVRSVSLTPLTGAQLRTSENRSASDTVRSVSLTPRAEQTLEAGQQLSEEAQANDALAWLFGLAHDQGVHLVMRGCGRGPGNYAQNRIRDWLAAIGDDAAGLARIIRATVGQAFGQAYEQLVDQHVTSARDLAAGQSSLPLGPTAIVAGRRDG